MKQMIDSFVDIQKNFYADVRWSDVPDDPRVVALADYIYSNPFGCRTEYVAELMSIILDTTLERGNFDLRRNSFLYVLSLGKVVWIYEESRGVTVDMERVSLKSDRSLYRLATSNEIKDVIYAIINMDDSYWSVLMMRGISGNASLRDRVVSAEISL